jgi:hypothetical protein
MIVSVYAEFDMNCCVVRGNVEKLMNRHKIWMFMALLCLALVGFSDTANGQITTTPPLSSGMSFQVQMAERPRPEHYHHHCAGATTGGHCAPIRLG